MIEFLEDVTGLEGASAAVLIAMFLVVVLLLIAALVSIGISIFLTVAYVKYNRKPNSAEKTGEEIAREVLDKNDLGHIKVSKFGSFLFGNSYSHFFKKVRLRRLTWQKQSVTSMAMATEKSALAILDKNGDKDMKKRIMLTPIIYFGPWAFVPLVLVGILLDVFIFNMSGVCSLIFIILGLLFYVASFVLSIMILKTEKHAQQMALQIMQDEGLATQEEIEMCAKLYKLYNIEYVNDMIIALLELIYRILQLIASIQSNSNN